MAQPPTPLTVTPLAGLPEIGAGADLAGEIRAAMGRAGLRFEDGDVLVVSSKVVSKAAGLRVSGADRDAVVASQSRRVVAERRSGDRVTRIVEALAGPVMAAGGVDASNTGPGGVEGADSLLLLPSGPDAAAADLHAALGLGGLRVAVLLTDTAGRPWRVGQTDFALGACGLQVVEDLRGGHDADGRELAVTARAVADELAAAADLVKGKAAAIPAALVRGAGSWVTGPRRDPGSPQPGAALLIRVGPGDWFDYGRAEAVRASLGVEPGTAAAEEAGIASGAPEPLADRVRRAVAVALWRLDGVAADVGRADVRLTADTPFDVGRAVARLEAALWGEGLLAATEPYAAGGAVVRVAERGAPPPPPAPGTAGAEPAAGSRS